MKLNISLISKIKILFIFIFALLCFTFIIFNKVSSKRYDTKVLNYHKGIVKYLEKERLNSDEIINYILKKDFELAYDPRKIIDNRETNIIRERGFETISFHKVYYLHIITPSFRILFKDKKNIYKETYIKYIIFIIITLLLIFIYLLIIKNIKDTNLLLNSRQLFLRTIMHELKTPIAKGRIVSELIDNEKQKNRMVTIFEKLDFLINDFAKIEQIVSKNYDIYKQNYTIKTIINNSIDMLMIDNPKDKIELIDISENKLNIDLDIFSMGIKNLIDNGLKYSIDKKIIIKEKNNNLIFISKGDKLPKRIEDYFKPFHNETKSKNHGMGLGLYIINEIVRIHNFKLIYKYLDNENIFIIELNQN